MHNYLRSSLLLLAAALSAFRGAEGGELPPLTIYWSRACPPCLQLVSVWNGDAEFRAWMKRHFTVQWVESNEYPLPRINVLGDELCGYAGKNRLAAHLQTLLDRQAESTNGRTNESTSECRGACQQQPVPTQVLPAFRQQILAELQTREEALRSEFAERMTAIDGELSILHEHTGVHADRLNELVAHLNQQSTSREHCRAQLAEVRTQLDTFASELHTLASQCEQFGESQAGLSHMRETQTVFEGRLSAIKQQLSTLENTIISRTPAVAADVASDSPDNGRSGGDNPPPAEPAPYVRTPSRTAEPPGPAAADLAPLLKRLAKLEERINQPFTVDLFDSGTPTGSMQIDPHGGRLPLDIHGEERVLSEKQTPATQE